jgi:hypothetical protein
MYQIFGQAHLNIICDYSDVLDDKFDNQKIVFTILAHLLLRVTTLF